MKKVYLVTGATGGLGMAVCEEIAKNDKEKAEIIIHYCTNIKNALKLQKMLLDEYNTSSFLICANFEKEKEVEALIAEVNKKYERVDVLINVAGIVIDKEIKERTYAEFEKVFKINVFSQFLVTKEFGRKMFENKYGKIVNISSVSATENYPTSIDYDASKAAINTMTKNFAIEFAPFVNVNAVAPGMIDTPFNADIPQDVSKIITSKILKNRWVMPDEIAKLVYYLTTNVADFINGSIIVADGGKK